MWKCFLLLYGNEVDLSLAEHYEALEKDFVVAVYPSPQPWHLYQMLVKVLKHPILNKCGFGWCSWEFSEVTFPIHSPVWTSRTFPTRPVSSCLKQKYEHPNGNCYSHTSLHTVQPLLALHIFHRLGPQEAARGEKILEVVIHPQLCMWLFDHPATRFIADSNLSHLIMQTSGRPCLRLTLGKGIPVSVLSNAGRRRSARSWARLWNTDYTLPYEIQKTHSFIHIFTIFHHAKPE